MRHVAIRAVSLLVLVGVTRFALLALGLAPDPEHLAKNWQTLALSDLEQNLAFEIWNLHSQPPLWNSLVGAASKLCSADIQCVVWLGYLGNLVLTWVSACLILEMLLHLKIARRLAAFLTTVFVLSPSTIYYEFSIFYAHPSMALMVGLAFCLCRFTFRNEAKMLIYALILAACLCWLWSLFHPMFIGVVFVCGVLINARIALTTKSLVVAALALGLALAPSIKNQIKFGLFMNGSWAGLNVSQVIRDVQPSFDPSCNFFDVLVRQEAIGILHSGTALNNPGMIPLSKQCLKLSMSAAFQSPGPIISNRLSALVERHSMMPHDYFLSPINWQVIPDLPFGRNGSFNNTKEGLSVKIFEWFTLGFYLFAFLSLVKLALTHEDRATRRYFASLLIIALWFTAMSFAFNRAEQQRMRYTIEPFFLITIGMIVSQFAEMVRSRRP